MTEEEQNKLDMAVLQKAMDMLSEHFCTVQIFCTRHDGADDCTSSFRKGCGNWFARYGQIREFVDKEKRDSTPTSDS